MLTLAGIDDVIQYPEDKSPGFVLLSEVLDTGEGRLQRTLTKIFCSRDFIERCVENGLSWVFDVEPGESGYFEARPQRTDPIQLENCPVVVALSPLGIWEPGLLGLVLQGTPYQLVTRLLGDDSRFWTTMIRPFGPLDKTNLTESISNGWKLSEAGTKVMADILNKGV